MKDTKSEGVRSTVASTAEFASSGSMLENALTQLNIRAWVKSDVGRVRKNNEDNCHADKVNGLFIVADGMGGHEHGELASLRAVESVKNYLYNAMRGIKAYAIDPSPERKAWLEQVIKGAIFAANAEVYALAAQKGVQGNMGTTLSLLLLLSPTSAIIGHVGDSRIYRIRNKEVQQLTFDQTIAQHQLRTGAIRAEDVDNVPFGNTLMQAVGYRQEVDPDITWIDLQLGDQFLLCSDGLSNYLIEDEIVSVFSQAPGEQIVPRLISCANQRGGKDNITAIVAEIEDPDASSLAATQLDLSTDILSQCPMLEGLEMSEIFQLLPLGQLKIFIRDEILQTESQEGPGLMIVLGGRVGLYRRNTWLATIAQGGNIGELEFFDNHGAAETAICEEEVRVIIFEFDKLRRFIMENPKIGLKILFNLSKSHAQRTRNHEARLAQVLGQQ